MSGSFYKELYELKSSLIKRVYIGILQGIIMGLIKGDTRSLDYSSYVGPTCTV